MDDDNNYEADIEKVRAANKKLLTEFKTWLKAAKLSAATIKKHAFNINFYINEYLLYEDIIEPEAGSDVVSYFLGYWFIKKATWASASSIKSNATSLTKFYTFLQEKGLVDSATLAELKATIKAEMLEWLATIERYDDESLDIADVWKF
jgi:hypothetical protein